MDFEYRWKGGGGRWRASEHVPLRLDRCHFPSPPCPPNLPVLEQASCPPVHKQDTLTHGGTHSRLGLELEKRFPERFLKVELLKAWTAASALKLHEPLSCCAYQQAEWRQCFEPLLIWLSWFSLLHCGFFFPNYKKVKNIFKAVNLVGQKI